MMSRTCTLLSLIAILANYQIASADEKAVVRLIDPRGVTHTKNTIDIEYMNARTDVMASRRLTKGELAKLRSLLKLELSASDDVPFCGHSPAYAVSITSEDGMVSTITLCGFCSTWARKGKLRVLKGTQSLDFLGTLLPMPDVFAAVKRLPDLTAMDRSVPFYALGGPAAK